MSEKSVPVANAAVDLQQPIVSVDMDDTLLGWGIDDFDCDRAELFDGVEAFLDEQMALHRACVVATAADGSTALGVLGTLGVTDKLSNGEGDIFAFDKLATRMRRCYDFNSYNIEPVGGFPVDSWSLHPNVNRFRPFESLAASGVYKDFRLLRAHLAGYGGGKLRLVHVGDSLDLLNMKSDPDTVMICVDDEGRWLGDFQVRQILGGLFCDREVLPAGIFDTIFADGKLRDSRGVVPESERDHVKYVRMAVCRLGEGIFTLGRGELGERVIFELRT